MGPFSPPLPESGNAFIGFTSGNFLQLAFPTSERFPCEEASHFAIALYILATSGHKEHIGEEMSNEQKDAGPTYVSTINGILLPFLLIFLLDAAWIRSRAERPSVSYTKVTSKVAWTSHNLQVTNKLKQQNCGSNKFRKKGGGTGR